MKKEFILLSFCLFLGLSLVSAEGLSAGVGKQWQPISLKQTCPNCTYVNVTSIDYPNGTTIQLNPNYKMTASGTSYIIPFNNTGQIGDYGYCMKLDLDGVVETPCASFTITPSGFVGTLGFYILILVLSLGIIILGFSLNDAPITILGSFGLYFIGLYILFYGIDGMKDVTYTWAIGLIVLSLAAYISIRSTYELIVD